jgi:membrane protein YdbS with pleckstrin-like domain
MPAGLRRFAWWSFAVVEAGLVAAATAYVGFGTRDFWLVVAAAVVAAAAYVATVKVTPPPRLGDPATDGGRWYWF